MTLSERRQQFCDDLVLLYLWCRARYPRVMIGEVQRHGDVPGGHPRSCHKYGLAVHMLLLIDTDNDGDLDFETDTEAYAAAGRYWESLRPENRWGGRFGDGIHFSQQYRGVS